MWLSTPLFFTWMLLAHAQVPSQPCTPYKPCSASQYCQVETDISGGTYWTGLCQPRVQVGDACPAGELSQCFGETNCNPCPDGAQCTAGLCRFINVAQHTACQSDSDCENDQFCHVVTDAQGGLLYSTCDAKVQVGDACQADVGNQCPDGAQCTRGLCRYIDVQQHTECDEDSDCGDGRSCQEVMAQDDDELLYSICQAPGEQGQACNAAYSDPCQGHLACLDGKCMSEGYSGDFCDLDKGFGCTEGTICERYQCRSDGTDGGRCPSPGDCSSVAWCDSDYVCQVKKPLREACSSFYECESNLCWENACAPNAATPCYTDADCSSFIINREPAKCQINRGEADSMFPKVCGAPITSGYGQVCKKTADCVTDGYACYQGACMSRYSVEGKTCKADAECGGWERKANSANFYYIKFGFTCTGGQCKWFNKNDGCVNFLDKITQNCYD
ncbi:hypothetical protein ASPZODRAFT_137155 [Penicilliopsis zonata CBS 506.65]|uniref:EGF-like domain-containing protein n=1 Tax=Penicilliopsis zonata CBS 506.65 TaxID=1073090 RepID=A0A1L9S5R7_9EURO|nr:hypothetical protein ASPZODRAFT_137155 [Penicilliopsis zonata CBS 506.65]OJJ42516.1 hypothetical protein ASPZODRAFT_137155 [Penicilliopsis zonata CBS 506.65]